MSKVVWKRWKGWCEMARRYYTDRYGRQRWIRSPARGVIPARVYDAGVERSQDLADDVIAEVKRTLHVVTGELKADYHVVDTAQGAVIVSPTRYWMFVEFGTEKHGPEQRNVRNALDMVRTRERGGRTPFR
jgi:hypothetical protein